jgi:hypothetical protein
MQPRETGVKVGAHPKHLEAVATGPYSADLLNAQIAEAVAACRKRKKSHLLLDLAELTVNLSLMDRYRLGIFGAEVGVGLKVAVLAKPEMIDARKFGVEVASNRGLRVDIFSDRPEAVRWLLSPKEVEK